MLVSLGDGKLDYTSFFNQKIEEKHSDNSYRKFRVLAASAGQFPTAKHYRDPSVGVEEGRDITIWCGNDYLGMGSHPDVINATMYVVKSLKSTHFCLYNHTHFPPGYPSKNVNHAEGEHYYKFCAF